jgi:hypothetical protein
LDARSVEKLFLKRSFVIRVKRVQSSSKFEEETTAVVVVVEGVVNVDAMADVRQCVSPI